VRHNADAREHGCWRPGRSGKRVTSRSYGHYCALASALDVVGERWTLLIVRELLAGPCRYVDLQAGIPGIATDVLSVRLKSMKSNGLIAQRTLPPASTVVYELTERGAALKGAVGALAAWGVELLGPQRGAAFRIQWAGLMLGAILRPERVLGGALVFSLQVEDQAYTVRIDAGKLSVCEPGTTADAVLTTDPATLVELARDPRAFARAVAQGRVILRGSRHALKRVREAFEPGPPRAERT
jgi:DNA-binding HxlR family transcriptional regulator